MKFTIYWGKGSKPFVQTQNFASQQKFSSVWIYNLQLAANGNNPDDMNIRIFIPIKDILSNNNIK